MSAQGGVSSAWPKCAVALGGTASIGANIAHAWVSAGSGGPRPGAVIASALWPVLVIVAVELLTAQVWPSGWAWSWVRFGGTGLVAVVAAVASYSHMSELLAHYGENPLVATLGPIAVDGLMVMATAALFAGRQRAAAQPVVVVESVADVDRVVEQGSESTPISEPEIAHSCAVGVAAPGQVPARSGIRSLAVLRDELAQAIVAGRLNQDPSAEAIRRELACSPARARLLRDERLIRRDSYRVLGSEDGAPRVPVPAPAPDLSPDPAPDQLPGQLVIGEVEGVSVSGLVAV